MIYRLNLQRIDGDDEGRLDDLRERVRAVPGVTLYDEGATEGWGVPFPDGYSVDFDRADATDADVAVLAVIAEFLTGEEELR